MKHPEDQWRVYQSSFPYLGLILFQGSLNCTSVFMSLYRIINRQDYLNGVCRMKDLIQASVSTLTKHIKAMLSDQKQMPGQIINDNKTSQS